MTSLLERPKNVRRTMLLSKIAKSSSGSSKGPSHTIDGMMLERAEWIEKLESENELLVNMVQEIKDCKIRFLDAVATVDEERNEYKAREVDTSDSTLGTFLENGMLSESKRVLLPTYMRADAENVHSQLSKLATQIRANQLEILQTTLNQVKEAEEAFIDQRYDDVDYCMEKLRNLASAVPGNVYAAESLMNDIVGTLQQVTPQTLPTSNATNKDGNENENENRKSKSMTLMERLQQKSERNRSEMKKFGRGGSSVGSGSTAAQTTARSKTLPRDSTSSVVDIHKLSRAATESDDFKALDEVVRDAMNKTIITYMKNVVKAHPLGSDLSDDLLETCAEEATLVLRNIVAPFLLLVQVQRLKEDLNTDAIEWVPSQVMSFLRSSEGHAEVLTIVMMILTYVHQRTATLDQQQNQDKDNGSEIGNPSDSGSSVGRRTTARKSVAESIRDRMSKKGNEANSSAENNSKAKRKTYTYLSGELGSNVDNSSEWNAHGSTSNDMSNGVLEMDTYMSTMIGDTGSGVATEYVETLDPSAKRASSVDVKALPRFMQPKGMGRRSVIN